MKALKGLDEVAYVRYASVYRDFKRDVGLRHLPERGRTERTRSKRERCGSAALTRADRQARSVARLAAVQALYQMEVAGVGVEAVVREFAEHRFGRDLEGQRLADADEAFFAEIVRGVVTDQLVLDAAIRRRLAANWKLDRLDATVRAVPSLRRLRAARPRRRAQRGGDRRIRRVGQGLCRRQGGRLRQRRPGRGGPRPARRLMASGGPGDGRRAGRVRADRPPLPSPDPGLARGPGPAGRLWRCCLPGLGSISC